MNLFKKINLILLVLLSLATGIVKVIRLEADVMIFERMGFSYTAIVLFGVIQTVGGILLIFRTTRKPGAVVMLITFAIASTGLFVSGMVPFGVFSLLFLAMAWLAFHTL